MNNNFSYDNVVKELNLIFYDFENTIKKSVEDTNNIKTRKRDISFIETLLFKFFYSVPSNTKMKIISSFNFDNDTSLTRQAFDYRDNSISVNFYVSLYTKISNLYKKLMNIDIKTPIIIAVDGTFNNINSLNKKDNLETSLNMGYYDVTNDMPLEISIEGNNKKNNELFILRKYLKKNQFPLNSILLLDRAYCSYDFINYLFKTNLKFVIRFRNNCKNFDKIKEINELRIIKYYDEFVNVVPHNKYKKYIDGVNKKNEKKNKKNKKSKKSKKSKKDNQKIEDKTVNEINNQIEDNNKHNDISFKKAEIQIKHEYTLLTNLNKNLYDDEKIKELYKKRWNIEIFFKLLKYNFKFEHLIEHNKNKDYDQYKKLSLINLISIYLSKIIEKTYYFNNKIKKDFTEYKKGKLVKYVYRPNKSNTITGVYKILRDLFNGNLKKDVLKKVCSSYVVYNIVELGLYKERKSKTPFLKWYVKGHLNRSLLYKFIEAFITNNTTKLNKNHKVLYSTCTIILK